MKIVILISIHTKYLKMVWKTKPVVIQNDTVLFSYTTEEDLLLVKNTLVKLGYPVVGEKNVLTTKAKSFVSCAIGRVNSN